MASTEVGSEPRDLRELGLRNIQATHWNFGVSQLIEEAIRRREGLLAEDGALVVKTGQFTGRSPKDKYIVREPSTENTVNWGPVNQPMNERQFDRIFDRMLAFWEGHELFVQDCFGGADPVYTAPVRVITQRAWHSLFARQLFIRPANGAHGRAPQFTIFFAPTFYADPDRDGTHSQTCIAVNFKRKAILICGTEYAGEVKKSMFTALNHLLPDAGVLPMHCSANIGGDGKVALFFGLSGTGKTTLSADASRRLIGDDEHGWSDRGVFNFEGGCYAKCIHLSAEKEPQIWGAIRYGTVLENVAMDPASRFPDFDSNELTENTRAAYPVEFIENAVLEGMGGQPSYVVFLAADAFGVLPPISRLTTELARYHFLSGYTAKLAGTERGLGKEPKATFSACFADPFLTRHPTVYARMLTERIQRHNVRCYLVNTGWVGGGYGTGERMSLPYTRAMVNAAITGELDDVPVAPHPVFQVLVPKSVPGVPPELLDARAQWKDPAAYDRAAHELQARFEKNYAQFTS